MEAYQNLSQAPISADGFEIVKIFDHSKGSNKVGGSVITLEKILYDTFLKTYYLKTIDYSAGLESMNPHIYWKLDEYGEIIDSLSIVDSGLFNTGIFFNEDHYIDWFVTGDPTPKKYLKVINDSLLSLGQIKQQIDQAIKIDLAIDYSDDANTKIKLLLYDGKDWSVLKSQKLFHQLEEQKGELYKLQDKETFSLVIEELLVEFKSRFTTLDYQPPSNDTSNHSTVRIEKIAFEKTIYFSRPFISFNNYGLQDWYGMNYYQLSYGKAMFRLKSEGFNSGSSLRKGITSYHPTAPTSNHLLFIHVGQKETIDGKYDDHGIYLIRKLND